MFMPDNGYYFRDPQQAPVYGFCPVCGGEIYNRESKICWYCEERKRLGLSPFDEEGEYYGEFD